MSNKHANKTRASKSGKGPAMDLKHAAEIVGIKKLLRNLPHKTDAEGKRWVAGMRRHYKARLKALQ